MKRMTLLLSIMSGVLHGVSAGSTATVGVWEKVEITLQADKVSANPYKDVEVWVDLTGPGFKKRCYGFWDGGKTFRVRVMAAAPGDWKWSSGSNKRDSGLVGVKGGFKAFAWTEAQKAANLHVVDCAVFSWPHV